MILHELEYATRIAVSCALSPPNSPDAADDWSVHAVRASNTLWLLQERVVGFYEEEKTECWRVPTIPSEHWGRRFKLAVDALVEADVSHLESLPSTACKYLSTWNRVLMRLSKHFGTLRAEPRYASPPRPRTNKYLRSPNIAVAPTARRRGIAGRRHRSVGVR